MKAAEIREKSNQLFGNYPPGVGAETAYFVAEVAAQLAELNEKLADDRKPVAVVVMTP